jgi:hypothetical protein
MKVILTTDPISEAKTDAEMQVRGIIPAEQEALKKMVEQNKLDGKLPETPKVERNISSSLGGQKFYTGNIPDSATGIVGSGIDFTYFDGIVAIPSQTQLKINNITRLDMDLFVQIFYSSFAVGNFSTNYTFPVYLKLGLYDSIKQTPFEAWLNPFLGNMVINRTASTVTFNQFGQTYNLFNTITRTYTNYNDPIFLTNRDGISSNQLNQIINNGVQLIYQIAVDTSSMTNTNDINIFQRLDTDTLPAGISGLFRVNLNFRIQGNQAV